MFKKQGESLSQSSQILKDLQSLMKDMERVDLNLSFESVPDKVILLLGETKAGKTTLMYYLLGMTLIREYNTEIGLYQMKPEAKIFDAQIGNDYQSATVYPNIPTELGEDKVLIIDMPGFSDTRYIYRLLNIYIIREVIKKIRSVHVSFVIPNETLEASFLASVIERNCLLLNERLVATPGCISFILTKVEDKESDPATFRKFMEVLKKERENDSLGEAINTLLGARIYLFENTDPRVESGVALKSQIVAENRFFQTDEKPDNLLSESYADIISGQQEPLQFSNFVIELLEGVGDTLTHLIAVFTAAVQLHHLQDLKLISAQQGLNQQALMDEVLAHAKLIHAAGVSKLQISPNDNYTPPSEEVRLLNLAKKFYRPQKDEVNIDLQIFKGDLESFIEWARLLAGEESRVSEELRRKMYELFKFCSKVLRTISHIKQPEIIAKFDVFCKSVAIFTAIEDYKRVDGDGGLIVKIAQSEIGARRLPEIEEFRQILLEVRPNFSFGEFQEVIESRKMAVRDKPKHKKIWEILETTKQMEAGPQHKHQQAKGITIGEISKDAISTIRNMPLEGSHLKTLFALVSKFRPQFEKTTDETKTVFGMVLFRKAAQLLEKLELYEEAILFYLAIPAEIEAEALIHIGMNFGEISEDFIRSILLPYYSRWSPNFSMVEALCNHLSLTVFDPSKLYANELLLAALLREMRGTGGKKLPFLKRFQFALVEHILTEENCKEFVLKRARQHEERLSKSKLPAVRSELDTMKIV